MGNNFCECNCNNDTDQSNETNLKGRPETNLKIDIPNNFQKNVIANSTPTYLNKRNKNIYTKDSGSLPSQNLTDKKINEYKTDININNTQKMDLNDNTTSIDFARENQNEDGFVYIGQRDSNGNKSGFGIHQLPDGSIFKGIFSNNQANGWGIYMHNDGEVFKGEYESDRTSGYGEYSNQNGANYIGYWIDDMQFGIGYEIWGDSSQYSGEYNNGKKDGIGTYIWSDNAKYSGEWNNNIIDGYGIYNFADGNQYSGQWKKNKMDGYGEHMSINGKKYMGYFKDDKKEGFGLFYWKEDTLHKVYVGFWSQGKQNGVGKYFRGDRFKFGVWNKGKREKWIDNKNEINELLSSEEQPFAHIFQWDINQIMQFMSIQNYNGNITYNN